MFEGRYWGDAGKFEGMGVEVESVWRWKSDQGRRVELTAPKSPGEPAAQ